MAAETATVSFLIFRFRSSEVRCLFKHPALQHTPEEKVGTLLRDTQLLPLGLLRVSHCVFICMCECM
jgi:hypothetical protein